MSSISTAGGSSPFNRDRFTWAAYGALLAFGFLNAVLGPLLPYLRAVEHISYLWQPGALRSPR
ncbi:MAG TPA: hypothetical protein VGH14_08585 [Solirubrobacterales bacterium]|jgi:hypothetical protein